MEEETGASGPVAHPPAGNSRRDSNVASGLDRVGIVDALRGIAAFAVAWFHFTNGNPGFLPDGVLKASGSNGWVGVEIFFVISGFVIPLSMWKGGYEIGRDWRRFIARRMVRLDPPYLVTIGLTIGLGYASLLVPAFQGTPPRVSTPQLLAHLGYLNAFLGFPWVNPVFWTLAIEFQYYLAAALLMPFIASADRRVRAVVLAALCLSPLLPLSGDFIFQYAPLFAMGMVAFQHRIGLISRTSFLTLVTGISAFCLVRMSPVVLLAGLGTAYCVGLLKVTVPRWLAFAGLISYSVYLIHVPIGGRVINLGTRLGPSMPTKIGVILAAMTVTTACGYLMYRLVELPAQRWSKRIVYLRSSGSKPYDSFTA